MRGMAAIVEFEKLRLWRHGGEPLQLLHGSVLVLISLNGKNGSANSRDIVANVPAEEIRMQPDVSPAPERGIRMGVIAGELVAQVARFVRLPRGPDTFKSELFDEQMRREHDDRFYRMLG